MEYASRLKGSITQALLKSLLADAGYRVIPLGIEEVVREISSLDEKEYHNLGLPCALRKMPDFLVTDRELKKPWLVEVKFRKEWNETVKESLGNQLKKQAEIWSPLHLIVFLGTPAKAIKDYPSAWIGVARLTLQKNKLMAYSECGNNKKSWDNINWKYLSRIQKVFTKLDDQEKWNNHTLQKTWLLLGKMIELDLFET